MTRDEAIDRLMHDVAKYITRAARNIREPQVPEVLVKMLHKDLFEYGLRERFEELALVLGEHPLLQEVRAVFAVLDRAMPPLELRDRALQIEHLLEEYKKGARS